MIKLIAVGLDGSAYSLKAMEEAVWLAKHYGAELHIVSVHEPVEPAFSASEALAAEQTARNRLEELQSEARARAEGHGVQPITNISSGNATNALAEYARKHGIDLLVIGDKGHSSIWGGLLGNTAEKIVRDAPCSVLVVR